MSLPCAHFPSPCPLQLSAFPVFSACYWVRPLSLVFLFVYCSSLAAAILTSESVGHALPSGQSVPEDLILNEDSL